MKHLNIILALITLMALIGTATATTVLDNGGFETGDFTNWSQYANGACGATHCQTNVTNTDKYAGTYSAKLWAEYAGITITEIYQTLPTTAGDNLTFYYKMNNSCNGTPAAVQGMFTIMADSIKAFDLDTNVTAWTYGEITINTTGANTIEFITSPCIGVGSNVTVYLDNITIGIGTTTTTTTTTPSPPPFNYSGYQINFSLSGMNISNSSYSAGRFFAGDWTHAIYHVFDLSMGVWWIALIYLGMMLHIYIRTQHVAIPVILSMTTFSGLIGLNMLPTELAVFAYVFVISGIAGTLYFLAKGDGG
jgi:hypothetical protein